jgi:DNA transposition AAA+ family ATPase
MKKTTVTTNTLLTFFDVFSLLQNTQDERIALITGKPSSGKTTAAIELNQTYPSAYCSCRPGWTQLQMVNHINQSLGLESRHSLGKAIDQAVDYLKANKLTVIVDELDHIADSKYTLLETLRAIHDEAHVPFLLVGMPSVLAKLNRHPQLVDRIVFRKEVAHATLEDCQSFFLERCVVPVSSKIVEKIFNRTSGNFRKIKSEILKIEAFAHLSGKDSIDSDYCLENAL